MTIFHGHKHTCEQPNAGSTRAGNDYGGGSDGGGSVYSISTDLL